MATDATPTIIELDDPPRRGERFVVTIVVLAFAAIMLAPFFMAPTSSTSPMNNPVEAAPVEDGICRPNVDVPGVLQPVSRVALPSYMRLCDWFGEPGSHQPPADDVWYPREIE